MIGINKFSLTGNIVTTGDNTSTSCIVRINDTSNFELVVGRSPFKNCQIFSIGGVGNLFHYFGDKTFSIIKQISSKFCGGKSTCLIDIHQLYYDKITDKSSIAYSMPYLNKTGSKMIMCLIHISKIPGGNITQNGDIFTINYPVIPEPIIVEAVKKKRVTKSKVKETTTDGIPF